jgi:membrane protease YdiL (CAAX protease family)
MRKRHASVVTFLAPVVFMIMHYAILSVTVVLRFTSYLREYYAVRDGMNYGDLLRDLRSRDAISELIAKSDVSYYASFYTMLIVIPVYLAYLYFRKRRSSSILLTQRVSGIQVLLALIIVFAAMGLTQLWMIGIQEISQSWPWLLKKFQSYLDAVSSFEISTSPLLFRILVIAILVPIGEELLFRGIVQGEMRRAFGSTVAVIVTALLFAIFHLDVIQSSYELTEQIAIPALMHMVFNFIGSGFLSQLFNTGETADQIILYVMIGFILPGIAALFFLRRIQKKKRASEPGTAPPVAKGW